MCIRDSAYLKQQWYQIGGFDAFFTSDVLVGSGLSSSAAFEVMIAVVLAGSVSYTHLNSTVDAFEQRIAALEGGVAALGVASGAAAITYTFLNLADAGENIVSAKTIYGGTYNLLAHTRPHYVITATFVAVSYTHLDVYKRQLLSNQKGLKKLRKRVLAMFEGKLKAVIETQKET